MYAKRTCRTRSAVSYQFKEYDELINSAIEDDLREPKPPRPPKPPGGQTGFPCSFQFGITNGDYFLTGAAVDNHECRTVTPELPDVVSFKVGGVQNVVLHGFALS